MSEVVATEYVTLLVRQMYQRTLMSGVVVPFVKDFEELIGRGLVHGFGPRQVFKSQEMRFGDCWMVLYMLSKREMVVVKGVDGRDWLEIHSTKGISKMTREMLMKSFYVARGETRFIGDCVVQWDRLKRVGQVWKTLCNRGAQGKFAEKVAPLVKRSRVPYKEFVKKLSKGSGQFRVVPQRGAAPAFRQ